MTKQNSLSTLSRRKMLAGIGAVGIASAGAGLGTSAYFSDREEFENNSLTAGELDLLVDWQQHYVMDGEATFVNAHPDHDGDGEQSIAADNDDGELSYTDFRDPDDPDGIGRNLPVLTCDNIPPLSEADYGVDPTTGQQQETLVQLGDVKPGDSGEITFSLHLCDNPGYIWMQADGVTESEGIDTDPELAVDDVVGGDLARQIEATLWYDADCDNLRDAEEPADLVLTLDFSGSMLYRRYGGVVSEDPISINGSSYGETTKIDLVELATREFVQYLDSQGADVKVAVAYFDGSQDGDPAGSSRTGILQPLTADMTVVDTALSGLRQKLANVVSGDWPTDPFDGDGNPSPSAGSGIAEGTYIGEGVEKAQDELAGAGARAGADKVNIVLSDGQSFRGQSNNAFTSPQAAATDARLAAVDGGSDPETDVYTIAVGDADDATLQEMAGEAGDPAGDNPQFFYDVDDPAAIPTVFGVLASQFVPEKVIMSDTLDNVLAELSDGNGIPLDGNVLTLYDELGEPADDADREPFRGNGLMYCVALSWELPFEVGNDVQGDTVAFDLGFYTEQARNNDGSGPTVTA
jgi:predicted ribosomally synthesized peptide with SipW-like signal peptide